jgi:hypothetical protein
MSLGCPECGSLSDPCSDGCTWKKRHPTVAHVVDGNIVPFPTPLKAQGGNGALEVMRDYFERIHNTRPKSDLPTADYILAWLWEQGFVVERRK